MIYLDNAATSFPKPQEVYDALEKTQKNLAFNAGRGNYTEANKAHELIENTRREVLNYSKGRYVIFTASATHAINQLIGGFEFEEGDVIYCSPYDHNAVIRTLTAYVKMYNIQLKVLPLLPNNEIDLEKMKFLFMKDKPKYVFSSHVSNVTGYILPIKEMGEITKKYNGTFIVDGAQAFGLVDINMKSLNIDYYVFAGHKTLYGPFGIAGFICNDLAKIKPVFFGGTGTESLNVEMPEYGYERFEPSSPNVVAIAGLQAGMRWIFGKDALHHEQVLYQYTLQRLKSIDGVIIYAEGTYNSVGIISLNLKGYKSDELAKILSEDFNISVRGGYHCCPFIHDYLDTKQFLGTVRVSFSYFTTKEDIDVLINALLELTSEF